MPEEKAIDIHDCQDWLRTAPLQEAQEFVWWAQGVIDGRAVAQPKRKTRSDAGTVRTASNGQPIGDEEPINLKEIVK